MQNVKAIPMYLDANDITELRTALNIIYTSSRFNHNTILILGQKPMSLDLYMSVRYDGINESSVIDLKNIKTGYTT